MAGRIIEMRKQLYELLTNKLKTPAVGPNGWSHITSQIGMFSYVFRSPSSILLLTLPCQQVHWPES